MKTGFKKIVKVNLPELSEILLMEKLMRSLNIKLSQGKNVTCRADIEAPNM